jgi:hypothetical protein
MKRNNHSPQAQGLSYAQRMQMQKFQTIAQQRDDAAMIALMLSCVALNDTEHLGPVRIHRFADRLNELIKEFYGDREMGVIHLHSRLQQMGFQDEIENLEKIAGV